MRPYITGLLYPQVKAARAGFHLKELRAKVSAFRNGQPYSVGEYDDNERGEHVIVIGLNRADVMIPVLVGEFAFSLRSALDHLAWQLGLLSGKIPSRASAFPIFTSDKGDDLRRFTDSTAYIPSEAVEVIKSLQPYMRRNRFKSDPLWQLNKLCNLDKHVTVGFSHTVVNVSVPPGALVIDSQEDLVTMIRLPLSLKGKGEIYLKPPDVVFGRPIEVPGPEFTLTEDEIAEIERYIREDVLPKFERFFPNGPTLAALTPLPPTKR